jgi:hypothetical protein
LRKIVLRAQQIIVHGIGDGARHEKDVGANLGALPVFALEIHSGELLTQAVDEIAEPRSRVETPPIRRIELGFSRHRLRAERFERGLAYSESLPRLCDVVHSPLQ